MEIGIVISKKTFLDFRKIKRRFNSAKRRFILLKQRIRNFKQRFNQANSIEIKIIH